MCMVLIIETFRMFTDKSLSIKPASTTVTSSRTSLSAGDEGFVLAAGNHGFQFDYTLPADLPSTFQGRWGNIKYSVKATLTRPGRFDIEREAEVKVNAHLDLNEELDLAVSLPADGTRTIVSERTREQ